MRGLGLIPCNNKLYQHHSILLIHNNKIKVKDKKCNHKGMQNVNNGTHQIIQPSV